MCIKDIDKIHIQKKKKYIQIYRIPMAIPARNFRKDLPDVYQRH